MIWNAPLTEGEEVWKSHRKVESSRWRLYLGPTSVARAENVGRAVGPEGSLGSVPVVLGPRGAGHPFTVCRPRCGAGCSVTLISPNSTAPTTAGIASRPACWRRPSRSSPTTMRKGRRLRWVKIAPPVLQARVGYGVGNFRSQPQIFTRFCIGSRPRGCHWENGSCRPPRPSASQLISPLARWCSLCACRLVFGNHM